MAALWAILNNTRHPQDQSPQTHKTLAYRSCFNARCFLTFWLEGVRQMESRVGGCLMADGVIRPMVRVGTQFVAYLSKPDSNGTAMRRSVRKTTAIGIVASKHQVEGIEIAKGHAFRVHRLGTDLEWTSGSPERWALGGLVSSRTESNSSASSPY
ncbi:hypothetical protein BJ508DRAFT_367481 [Ascobolus immersus RN42]|uniref:Uncharacterized protein n=1 Tax=Ascobolus immersus RN42 TaxID=1160509 RepID=A0A3N4HCC6_ASCIM|nr:hypothetical protein BJ508DRAFT_367481 [Ascobolus immersus RN42]